MSDRGFIALFPRRPTLVIRIYHASFSMQTFRLDARSYREHKATIGGEIF